MLTQLVDCIALTAIFELASSSFTMIIITVTTGLNSLWISLGGHTYKSLLPFSVSYTMAGIWNQVRSLGSRLLHPVSSSMKFLSPWQPGCSAIRACSYDAYPKFEETPTPFRPKKQRRYGYNFKHHVGGKWREPWQQWWQPSESPGKRLGNTYELLLKNTYELLNLRSLKFSPVNKI